MRILSFDVGIVNLAYCCIDITDDSFNIIDWNVISLCGASNCCQCSNPVYVLHPNGAGYCRTHAKKEPLIMPPPMKYTSKLEFINKAWMPFIERAKGQEAAIIQHINAAPLMSGIINSFDDLKLSTRKKDELVFQLRHIVSAFCWRPKPRADDTHAVSIGRNLKAAMDALLDKVGYIHAVVIENQLGKLAVKMMRVQGMITQYFIDRGIEHIDFISAAKKLGNELMDELGKKYDIDKYETGTYADRKKASVHIVSRIVSDRWLLYFQSHKKKDDLADCFLQAFAYSQAFNND